MNKRLTGPVLLVTGAMNLALLVRPSHPLRYLAAFILLWVLPGLVWAFLLARRDRGPDGAAMTVGLGLGLASSAALTLLLYYLPGRLNPYYLLACVDALIVGLGAWAARREPPGRRLPVRAFAGGRRVGSWTALAALLLLTVTLRLANLGYSEFQGDEAVIMARAARALEGDHDALFMHQKGPAEILLPMATWRLSGTIDEFWARLPFAYAGVLGVLTVALLGRRLFDAWTGWLASLLMAISGYHVAFGRIVQYQSIVLLATATALLALWRWVEGGRARWLNAGAVLLAFGALGHYDAVMALPAALYLVAARLRSHPPGNRAPVLPPLFLATVLGLALLAIFYLPYALSPNFAKTFGYLSGERIGGGGPIYDNLGSSLVLSTVYNSSWYVGGLALAVVGASAAAWRGLGRLIPLALVGVALLGSSALEAPLVPFVALTIWFAAAALTRSGSRAWHVAWLWFGAPFLFFHFVVWDPRTHVLNLFPGACLIAAWGMSKIAYGQVRQGARGPLTAVFGMAGLAFLGLMSYYPFWMFIDHTPEVLRTWPEHRHPLYPTVYEQIPPFGLFGFPHRAGWKVAGALFDDGQLTGSYASNEEVEVTGWYTRGAERTYCPGPDLYIVAGRVQDEIPLDWADLRDNYREAARVDRGDRVSLRLYTRGAPAQPVTYRLRDWVAAFDASTTPEAVLPPASRNFSPIEATLGNQVRLLGYRLEWPDEAQVAPGDTLDLIVYWEALAPLERSYHVFTHLYRDGEMWGQADSIPQCGLWPTLRWQPGEVVADRYRLTLRPDTPAGLIPLTVGMYTLPDGARLPIHDADGVPLGDALTLTNVQVMR